MMTSMLPLVKNATALNPVTEQARSGLSGLQVADGDPAMLSSIRGFMAYDDLVKAKGILDLIVELPSFDVELGRYSASLELCGSILARSIQRSRRALAEPTSPWNNFRRQNTASASESSTPREGTYFTTCLDQPSDSEEDKISTPPRHKCTPAGMAEMPGTSTSPCVTITPTTWEPDDALTFDSIVGNPDAKRALFEHVVLPLKLSEAARRSLFAGIRSSGNNVLLHGPPGTGKTTIAKAASQEAGAAFFSVTPSSILSKYQGESERVLCRLFDKAKSRKPSIVFLDEVDALVLERKHSVIRITNRRFPIDVRLVARLQVGTESMMVEKKGLYVATTIFRKVISLILSLFGTKVQSRRLLAELLLQTSQVRPKDRVVVVAATNRIDDVDVAFLRRFHSRIFVGPPGPKDREAMIVSFLDGVEHCLDDHHLASLADRTAGWSGSDIKSLCREACMGPIRSLYEEGGELERLGAQQTSEGGSMILRPVQISDCDTAYGILMGSSSTFCDQAAAPVCDDVVLTREAMIGGGPLQCHEDYTNMLTADAVQGEDDVQRDSQTSATQQLSSEMLLQKQQQQ